MRDGPAMSYSVPDLSNTRRFVGCPVGGEPAADPAVTAGDRAAGGDDKTPKRTSAPAMARRVAYISWLRAIAAGEVIVWHSDLITKHFSPSSVDVWGYHSIGAIGVEVFFVLSGYMMCMRAASYRNGAQYLLARLVRLVPMYWLFTSAVIAAYLVNSRWHLGNFDLSVFHLLRSYLMLPAWGFPILSVGWTLEYEMIFYALVALLAVGAGSAMATARISLFAMVIALGLGGMLMPGAASGEGGPLATPVGHFLSPYMLTFAVGWLIRLVEENGGIRQNWRTIIGVLIIFSLALSQGAPDGVRLGLRAVLASCCFLLFQLGRQWFQSNNRVNRFMCLLGEASYSIYLSHWFVLSIIGKLLGSLSPPEAAVWPLRMLGIAAGLAFGLGAYLLLEQPIDRFLRVRLFPSRIPASSSTSVSVKVA
jgi:exopolysaccharide production protein ExoZ